jgi:hypothetical protein
LLTATSTPTIKRDGIVALYGNNGYANSAQYNFVVRCPNIVVNCIVLRMLSKLYTYRYI